MSANLNDPTPASEAIVDAFDDADISFMQSELGETPAADSSAGAAGAQGAAAGDESADALADQAGAEEQPLKDEQAAGEKKQAAEAAAGDEKPEEKEAAAKQGEESGPIRELRAANRTLTTKLTTLEQSVGTLAPVIKSVGTEPLTQLATFVTSDKGEEEFAPEFCRNLETLDPMRYDQVGQFIIDESIKLAPRPVLEEIVRQHGDKAAEMLFGKGATWSGVKQAWAGRNAKPAAAPAKDDETGYTGLDEFLEDETPEEERARVAARPEAEEGDVSKLPRWAQEQIERAKQSDARLQKLEENVTKGSESAQFEADTRIAEQFLEKALEPLKVQITDAGLAVLPDDSKEEQARKRAAVERIYGEVITKLRGDKRSGIIGEYIEQYHKMPPDHRIEQARALAEELAEEIIAYHADTLHRKRTAQTKQITDTPSKNVGGNNQGRVIPGHTPRSEALQNFDDQDDDARLAQETRELVESGKF